MATKVDVKSPEAIVVKNLWWTIQRDRRSIIPEHLERAKSSETELHATIRGTGFEAFLLDTERGWPRHRLRLRRGDRAGRLVNMAWIALKSAAGSRCHEFVRA